MSEERRMILEMLADKKITAQEAVELLQAIGSTDSGPTSFGPTASDSGRPVGASGVTGTSKAARETGSGPSEDLSGGRSILEDFLGRLDIDWSNLPFAFGGEAYRFDEEHHGEFASGKPVVIDFTARNGRVEVYGSDESGWRVVIRKKIRAQDEAKARQRAAEISTFSSGPSKLSFEEHSTGWANSGVSIEAHVPRHMVQEVRARSTNGRVVIEGLKVHEVLGKTANGKVAVRGVQAEVVELATANGGVTFDGGCTQLECGTANGQINICPRPTGDMHCSLHTSNGSIRVNAPHNQDIGYRIDTRTGHGALNVALDGFEVSYEEKQFGRRRLRGQSTDYAAKRLKVDIAARTTNGSIKVTPYTTGDNGSQSCGTEGEERRDREAGGAKA